MMAVTTVLSTMALLPAQKKRVSGKVFRRVPSVNQVINSRIIAVLKKLQLSVLVSEKMYQIILFLLNINIAEFVVPD